MRYSMSVGNINEISEFTLKKLDLSTIRIDILNNFCRLVSPMQHSDVRDSIIRRLRLDVLGPEVYDNSIPSLEELRLKEPTSPQFHYAIGHLHPRKWTEHEEIEAPSLLSATSSLEEVENEFSSEEENANLEPTPAEVSEESEEVKSRSTLQSPSSCGLTFCLGPQITQSLNVKINYSTYKAGPKDKETEIRIWKRHPFTLQKVLTVEQLKQGKKSFTFPSCPWLELRVVVRKSRVDDLYRATLTLTNTFQVDDSSLVQRYRNNISEDWIDWPQSGRKGWRVFKDEQIIHQPILKVESKQFHDVRQFSRFEDELGALLYHEVKVLAKGHNIGVGWDVNEASVWTDWVPSTEIPKLVSANLSGLPDLETLCDVERKSEVVEALKRVVVHYRQWIQKCQDENHEHWYAVKAKNLAGQLEKNLLAAADAADRIDESINLLEKNRDAWQAFVWMNQSIQRSQMCPSVQSTRGDRAFNWRPFQLFFILLNLRGLTRNGSQPIAPEERNTLDLLWFPTGGGKTEAYLGLIAYAAFLRRIQGETQTATVAIMRYTLRLLTMQQGERATRLILAMNMVGKENRVQGVPFTVGMWIGNKTSPGTINDARKTLQLMAQGKPLRGAANPAQIPACPWCGSEFNEEEAEGNYRMNGSIQSGKAFDLVCTDEKCEIYEKPLPYSCIDEEVYANPPTLLISTVDKFARMSSKPEAAVFLGKSTPQSPHNKNPPELIILDELHLLSGPLGSIAGLWESALQSLMGEWRPKYIAATATIRGAEKEVRSMFGRDLKIFPPPAASIKDNYFSKEQEHGERDSDRGRIHLSLLASPARSAYGYYGPMASLLQSANVISQVGEDAFTDPWWTVISYFNSRKEMAAAHNMLGDQVVTTLQRYALNRLEEPRDFKLNLDELHGGRKPSELKNAMRNLEIPYGSSSENPLDVLQTTNMFQVGIDIDRLGVMVLTGQPFSNAEYVQASGRVGRQTPGLVLTTLRGSKPRDLSFYENHQTFHHRMYANVEAGSTTPFSPAVLDRAMRSILMLLARVGVPVLADNKKIRALREETNQRELKKKIESFLDIVSERISDPSHLEQVENSIARMHDDLRFFIKTSEEVGWRARRNKPGWGHQVMRLSGGQGEILDSMRDVDVPVPIGNEPRENQEAWKFTTLASRQLFFRSGPGLLWEDEDGGTHMTLALNRWAIDDEQRNKLEYQSPLLEHLGDKLGKERFNNRKMRFHRPPRDVKTEGVITVDRLPYHRLCKKGHISAVKHDENCPQCGNPTSPVPLVSVCSEGHIDPFNWNRWIGASHTEKCSRRNTNDLDHILVDRPSGSTSVSSWKVTCTECKGSSSLMGYGSDDRGWACREHQPWIKRASHAITAVSTERNSNEERVTHKIRHLDRGNSGVGVGEQRLSLEIPPAQWHLANSGNRILWGILSRKSVDRMVKKLNDEFEDPDELLRELAGSDYLSKDGMSLDEKRLSEDAKAHYISVNNRTPEEYLDKMRRDELKGFTEKTNDDSWSISTGEFCREIVVNKKRKSGVNGWENDSFPISELVRIDKMRAIRILTGVTRNGGNEPAPVWDIESGNPWGLAEYENGEGIYFGLDLKWLDLLAQRYMESGRIATMTEVWANKVWPETKEQLRITEPLDVAKIVVLHTFSHLLMKEICTIAGYPMSSLSERLYLDKRPGGRIDRAGVLIYVTGAGNAGTLGGLSSLATPERIYEIILRTLESVNYCSNDPVCGSHEPEDDRAASNGASCHACTLLPEVSCELGNLLLDRSSIEPGVADDVL